MSEKLIKEFKKFRKDPELLSYLKILQSNDVDGMRYIIEVISTNYPLLSEHFTESLDKYIRFPDRNKYSDIIIPNSFSTVELFYIFLNLYNNKGLLTCKETIDYYNHHLQEINKIHLDYGISKEED